MDTAQMAQVLIIDGDEEHARELGSGLEADGHRTSLRTNGRSGLEAARTGSWDLLILDLSLPGLDGLRIIQTLRREAVTMPILVHTDRSEEASRILAFRTGADAYLTRPVSALELAAQTEALLRRAGEYAGANGNGAHPEPFRFADVEVDPATRIVQKGGEDVALTPKEFDLLVALMQREGRVARRDELLREVWKYRAPVESRTVDTHMSELRRKLEDDPSHPRHLITVRKVGYRCEA